MKIFCNSAKTFDPVFDHNLLDKKNMIWIRVATHKIVGDYIHNRIQSVKKYEFFIDIPPLNYGVAQGSILDPTAFLVYKNSLLYTCHLPIA